MTNIAGSKPSCLRLWHGTYNTDPKTIYEGVGLNINYSSDGNLWGKAIYFAVNAIYSCGGVYKYTVPNQQDVYEVFFANVVTGKEIEITNCSEETKKFREPPFIPNTNHRYDSVKGYTGNSDVYMVY